MQNFRRVLASLACLVVGLASFALSYVALRDVSVALGAVPSYLGWLVPIVIDGGIICGSAVIWTLSKEQGGRPKFPFFFVGSMVLMSVVVNVAHAGDSILAKVIAALPPLILLGTLELVADQGRRVQGDVKSSEASEALEDSTLGSGTSESTLERLGAPELPLAGNVGAVGAESIRSLPAVPQQRSELNSTGSQEVTLTSAPTPVKAATRASTRVSATKAPAKSAAAKAPAKSAAAKPAATKAPAKAAASKKTPTRVNADNSLEASPVTSITRSRVKAEAPEELSRVRESVAAMSETSHEVKAKVSEPSSRRNSSSRPLRVSAAAPEDI